MKKIFEIKHLVKYTGDHSGNISSEGTVPVFEIELGLYDSLKKAEKIISRNVDENTLGFIVFERSVNNTDKGPFNTVSRFESTRSYNKNGDLICCSDLDDACIKKFHGRSTEDIPFMIGENVIVRRSENEFRIGRICQIPFSEMEREKFTDADYSDDSFLVALPDGTHCHPLVTEVFRNDIPAVKSLYKKLGHAFNILTAEY